MLKEKVLALDPAFNNIGYAVFEYGIFTQLGVINPIKVESKSVTRSDYAKAMDIASKLRDLIATINPGTVVFEIPMGSRSARANRLLGMVTGILSAVISEAGIRQEIVTPREVKMLFGNNDTTKQDIIDWAYTISPLVDTVKKAMREHASDAMAACFVYLNMKQNLN